MIAVFGNDVVVGLSVAAAVSFATIAFVLARLVAQDRAERAEAAVNGETRKTRRPVIDGAYEGSSMVQRAIEITANLAERRGMLGSVERSLAAADIPMRPAEVIFAYVLLAGVVPTTSILLLHSTKLSVFTIFTFVLLPPYALKFYVKLRRKKFVGQLPDTLTALGGSLRAGRSLTQALEALSRDTPAPMGRELRKIVAEIRLGRPLVEALDEAVSRVGSPDFKWAALAIQIQAEVGGNLAELLDRVAETMRSRVRLKGEVKALTAEGRASAMMLVVLPPGLGLVMYAVNPDYMSPLFKTTAGNIIVGVSAVMIVGGYFWMKKVITIDV